MIDNPNIQLLLGFLIEELEAGLDFGFGEEDRGVGLDADKRNDDSSDNAKDRYGAHGNVDAGAAAAPPPRILTSLANVFHLAFAFSQ